MGTRRSFRNHVLAARIAELEFSQSELAGLLNEQWQRLYGQEGRCGDRYVRNFLDGTVTWPQSRYRSCLEVVFGCSVLELGFIPPKDVGYAGSKNSGADQNRDTVKRREFLRLGVAVGVARYARLPDVPAAGRIGASDVEKLKADLADLHDIDDRLGGGAALQLALASAARVQEAASSGRASDRVSKALTGGPART